MRRRSCAASTDLVTHPPILETRTLDVARREPPAQPPRERWPSRRRLRNAFIELQGALGAGKTTFARHLLRALGVTGRIKSPTYAVMEPYELPRSRRPAHFDFYRFDDPHEWEDAGFRDVFASAGLKLAEWPEKAGRRCCRSPTCALNSNR